MSSRDPRVAGVRAACAAARCGEAATWLLKTPGRLPNTSRETCRRAAAKVCARSADEPSVSAQLPTLPGSARPGICSPDSLGYAIERSSVAPRAGPDDWTEQRKGLKPLSSLQVWGGLLGGAWNGRLERDSDVVAICAHEPSTFVCAPQSSATMPV
eukprot:366095-Chlamydomonas_euryale.AAC.7